MVSIRRRKRMRGVRWVVAWRDPDGRQRIETCRTREDAELIRARKVQELGSGPRVVMEDLRIRLKDYARRWLRLVAASVKPATHASYANALDRHILPLLGDRRLRDLTRADVKDLVTRKLTEPRAGDAPGSCTRRCTHCSTRG